MKQFEIGPMQNFGYLIADDRTKEALIIDPAWDPDKLNKMVSDGGYKLKGFAITHAHYDHVNGIEVMLYKHDVPVYANKAEIEYAKSGNSIVGDLGSTVKAVESGEKILLGDTEITFLHMPGHTPGSQLLKIGDKLLTGDTLFMGGCGRADLPGGDAATLFQSLQKIAKLPANLEVFPGHDYGDAKSRLLGDEMKVNPYLRMRDEDSFVDAVG